MSAETQWLHGDVAVDLGSDETAAPRRSTFSMRLVEDMRSKLQASADRRRRPLSEEIEHRLQNSLLDEEQIGSFETTTILRMIGMAIRLTEVEQNKSWWQDQSAVARARETAIDVLEAQLGKSPRWWTLPPFLLEPVREFLRKDVNPGLSPAQRDTFGLMRLIRSGLEAEKIEIVEAPAGPEGLWISLSGEVSPTPGAVSDVKASVSKPKATAAQAD